MNADGSLTANSERCDLERCRPPYGSTRPSFTVTKARVDARGERVGAHSILSSCYSGIADFGRYVLEGHVHRFSEARLSGPRPITTEESGEAFFKEVVAGRSEIERSFSGLRIAYAERRVGFDLDTLRVIVPPADRRRIVRTTASLLALLTPAQRKRFEAEASAWVKGSGSHEWFIPGKGKGAEFDAQKCKVWVANRALSFGWTAERFPGDQYLSGRNERGGRIERIGKKYQRIAMMELLARLADNFWLKPQWGSGAAVYNNPLDVEFTRDLEPSIMPADQETTTRADLLQVPPLVCEPLPVERRSDWVADPDLPRSRLALATCPDLGEPGWLTLYRYAGHDIDAEREDRHLDAPWLQSDFHFLAAVLLSPDERARLIKDAAADEYDFHEWLPGQTTDGPYVGELARRDTWPDEPWTTLDARVVGKPRSYRVIRPTADFLWESHLDGSLPGGFSRHVPIPWLIRGLELTADTNNLGVYLDAMGAPTIVAGRARGDDRGSYVLVRREPFVDLARENNVEPIWTVTGERRAATLKKKRHPDLRVRYNGLLWFEDNTEKYLHWSKND